MTKGEFLLKVMKEKGYNTSTLSKESGVPYTTIRSMIERDLKKAAIENVIAICKVLGISVNDIINSEIPDNMERIRDFSVRIPILGQIACGDPIHADENFSGYRYKSPDNLPSGTLYILEARGSSMEPTIPNGAEVLIREQAEVSNGEIAAVLVNGDEEATLKRIRYQGNTMMLMPDNNSYDPIVVSEDYPVKIIGKAIQITTNL